MRDSLVTGNVLGMQLSGTVDAWIMPPGGTACGNVVLLR